MTEAGQGERGPAVNTTVYFIRHGQIQANVDRIWHGTTDSELTGVGVAQAEALGAYFAGEGMRFDALYASPLRRTMCTAESVGTALGLAPVPVRELIEYGIGSFEGFSFQALLDRGFFREIESNPHYAPPGGESPHQVKTRMVDAILDLARRHAGGRIAIVSHGAAMGLAFNHFLHDRLFPFNKYHMDNTGVAKALVGEGLVLEYFNKMDHMGQPSTAQQRRVAS